MNKYLSTKSYFFFGGKTSEKLKSIFCFFPSTKLFKFAKEGKTWGTLGILIISHSNYLFVAFSVQAFH